MSDAPKLKPCPFCGGVPYLANVAMPGCSYVVCTDCRMQSDDGSKDRVVKKWNTRNDTAVSKARVDALKEASSVCWMQSKRRGDQASTVEIGIQRARWIAGKIQAETDAQIIDSLIEKEPKP